MDKHVVRWSYLLCLVCFLVAFLWRAASAFGLLATAPIMPGVTVYYMSFYKAGLMFGVIAIAAASYAQMTKQ
jgi:hypothetical protein